MLITFSNLKVEIADDVLSILLKYEQTDGKAEAGGILLGKYAPEEQFYLISAATEPCDSDRFGPLWFVRDYTAAQRIIDKAWADSQGIQNYIGEWHTHPWRSPKPSFTDKVLMKKLVRDHSNVWNHMFMIIGGLEQTFYLGVCDCSQKGRITEEIVIGGQNASILHR